MSNECLDWLKEREHLVKFEDLTAHEIFCLIINEPDITIAFIEAVQGKCHKDVAIDMLMDYIEEKDITPEYVRGFSN